MRYCTDCGSPVNEEYAFCQNCGAKMSESHAGDGTVFGSPEKYVDTRDYTPAPFLAVISFLIWWLGLILYAVNKSKYPGRATSAIKGVLAFLCVLVPLAGLFMFIAWVRERKDFAKVAGISAIVGVGLFVLLYVLYICFIFVLAFTI